jgi:hypothetical protein
MFVFLADEENRIEIPGRRAGQNGSERFTSLLEMQAFKRRVRENSRSQVGRGRGSSIGDGLASEWS